MAIFKKWRFSAVLSFLDPFTTPRETSGNMGQEDWTAETSYEESLGDEAAAGQSELWSGEAEAGPSSGPSVCDGWLSEDIHIVKYM